MRWKVKFLFSTPRPPLHPCVPPLLSRNHSWQFFPIFLEFPMYILTSSHTVLLLTHLQETFNPGILQHSTCFVRKSLIIFVWPDLSICCYYIVNISPTFRDLLWRLYLDRNPNSTTVLYPHTPCSPLSTQHLAQYPSQRGFDKCMIDAWVSTLGAHVHTHTFFPQNINGMMAREI